jgi:hypothetical protein
MARGRWPPDPEESSERVPPGRRPPTAVGTATPEPPHQPERSERYSHPAIRRVTEGLLGTAFLGAAGFLVWPAAAATVIAVPLAVLGIELATRAIAGEGIRGFLRTRRRRRAVAVAQRRARAT